MILNNINKKYLKLKMKVYPIFIILSLLQVLICDIEGVSQTVLHKALTKSLPFIKSSRPERIDLPSNKNFQYIQLTYSEINNYNIQLFFDDYDLLHIKFSNLNAKLKGQCLMYLVMFTANPSFEADLNNISIEQTFALKSSNLGGGKYNISFKSAGFSDINFNILKLNVDSSPQFKDKVEKIARSTMHDINFNRFKEHLNKLTTRILENLKMSLK